MAARRRSEEHTSELQSHSDLVCRLLLPPPPRSTLFPYTTLFRSLAGAGARGDDADDLVRKAAVDRDLDPELGQEVHDIFCTAVDFGVALLAAIALDLGHGLWPPEGDRKSTRLNSSHTVISYAVFCYRHHRDLHSFPTRRSSDLWPVRAPVVMTLTTLSARPLSTATSILSLGRKFTTYSAPR